MTEVWWFGVGSQDCSACVNSFGCGWMLWVDAVCVEFVCIKAVCVNALRAC